MSLLPAPPAPSDEGPSEPPRDDKLAPTRAAPPEAAPTPAQGAAGAVDPVTARPAAAPGAAAWRWLTAAALLSVVLALGALWWVSSLHQRLRSAEREFAQRHQEAAGQAAEARTLSRQAEAVTRDMAAKVTLLEGRLAEVAVQRSQLEELMQSLSRSRDENVLADIDAALRVAQQQSSLTGSAEPLITALKQTDERLARVQQPRLERVRRAALKDLDSVRAAGSVDLTTLTLRLDEVTRLVDELPLLAAVNSGPAAAAAREARPVAPPGRPGSAAPGAQPADSMAWWSGARSLADQVWQEARQLIRVTRIDAPEAALLAPEQAFFLRENLKLRLLNARLALLSRQFDVAQTALRLAKGLLER